MNLVVSDDALFVTGKVLHTEIKVKKAMGMVWMARCFCFTRLNNWIHMQGTSSDDARQKLTRFLNS